MEEREGSVEGVMVFLEWLRGGGGGAFLPPPLKMVLSPPPPEL